MDIDEENYDIYEYYDQTDFSNMDDSSWSKKNFMSYFTCFPKMGHQFNTK